MLSNAYFLAKFRFDTAENEPAKNLQILQIKNLADRNPPDLQAQPAEATALEKRSRRRLGVPDEGRLVRKEGGGEAQGDAKREHRTGKDLLNIQILRLLPPARSPLAQHSSQRSLSGRNALLEIPQYRLLLFTKVCESHVNKLYSRHVKLKFWNALFLKRKYRKTQSQKQKLNFQYKI